MLKLQIDSRIASLQPRGKSTLPRIVGIDPGKTTGICCFLQDGRLETAGEASSLSEIWEYLEEQQPRLIVMEAFYGGMMRLSRDPLMVIGVVRLWSDLNKVPVIEQSPSILQSSVVWKMKSNSEWISVKSPHTRSAMAHVLYHQERAARAKP